MAIRNFGLLGSLGWVGLGGVAASVVAITCATYTPGIQYIEIDNPETNYMASDVVALEHNVEYNFRLKGSDWIFESKNVIAIAFWCDWGDLNMDGVVQIGSYSQTFSNLGWIFLTTPQPLLSSDILTIKCLINSSFHPETDSISCTTAVFRQP